MATAEEVLQTMAEVPESAPACVIDPETRTIIVPPEYQLFGVENDKRVERLYFQCPKIVGDNQDLSQDYQLFMNYQNANGDPDAYHIEDMEVDGDNITFSWLLEENVTKYRGNIQFAFGAIIPGDETEDTDKNRWNTTINTDCTCLVGLKCTQQVAESNPDALVQIWAAIDELKAGGGGTGGTTNYNNLSNKPKLNGVTLEGNKTLDQVGVLAKNQGASNSGKFLSVGSDGNVVPADAPSGGGGGSGITEETDPTVPAWAKEPTKPTYTAVEVGADASGTAEAKVSVHNTAVDAHSDIRLLVQELTTRLTALADSDDDTLDQMSEIVAYIKNNKSLIDGITTSKVNVSDIVNDVVTSVSNRPLSAAQGVVLKGLIDAIKVPEKLPSPKSLTIKTVNKGGSSNQITYDGSQEKSIEISPATLGLDTEEEPTSSGQLILLKSVGLTSWAQNNSITVNNMSDYDMIGISVISNTTQSPYDVSGIQWFKIPVSGSITYSIMSSTYDRELMVLEVESRLIRIGTNQITAESKGYYYSWKGIGNDETHAVPYEIYGMKF